MKTFVLAILLTLSTSVYAEHVTSKAAYELFNGLPGTQGQIDNAAECWQSLKAAGRDDLMLYVEGGIAILVRYNHRMIALAYKISITDVGKDPEILADCIELADAYSLNDDVLMYALLTTTELGVE